MLGAAPRQRMLIAFLGLLSAAVIAGCGNTGSNTLATGSTGSTLSTGQTGAPSPGTVEAVLTRWGGPAEDTYYSCLYNLWVQGISIKQAKEECDTKLLKTSEEHRFEEIVGDELAPKDKPFFDPTKITAACNPGTGGRGQSKNETGKGSIEGYGNFSWGRGQRTEDYRGHGFGAGLSEKQSFEKKMEAVQAAEKALKEFDKAQQEHAKAAKELEKAKKDGDKQKINDAEVKEKQAKEKLDKATKEAKEKDDKAKQDPNNGGVTQTTGDISACEEALQGAREVLYECNRNGWKSSGCQQLEARKNHCPDPTMIYTDPEQGYACGIKVDEKALKEAWSARCEELKNFGPDGGPCRPPTFTENKKFIKGKIGDICNDPAVRIDPDSSECQATFTITKTFGEPDIQKLAVWGINNLGGPIFVPPDDEPNPRPKPGPEPRPGPS